MADSRSIFVALWSRFKRARSGDVIRGLEHQLNNFQNQLALQLTFLNKSDSLFILSVVSFILTQASSEIKDKLMGIGQDAKSGISMLQTLQKHVEELRQGVMVKSISPGAVDQLESLHGLSESACNDIARQHIRRSLAFPDMRVRVEAVEKAHVDTFSWLLDRSSDSESEDRVRTQDLFLNWLST